MSITPRLFSHDSVLPLDQFVLSTEAHPVPILGKGADKGLTWPCGASSKTQEDPDQRREQVQMAEPMPSDVSDVPSDSQMEDAESPTSKQVCDPKRVRELQEQMKEGERHLQKIRREYGLCVSDPSCWASGYNYEDCCFPPPHGNAACWDAEFTYDRCCR
eukprot:symbB.v1.2.032604.t1/scaffold3933.1/size58575/14